MKKNKTGFTLAEVLVTLGIIGVIAALTIPALTKSTQKSSLGASVGKTVSVVQNGIANIFTQANDMNEDGTLAASISALKVKDVMGDSAENADRYLTEGDTLFSELCSYINLISTDTQYTSNIKIYSGDDSANLGDFPKYRFTKGKSIVIIEPIDNNSIPENIASDTVIAKIYIDGNGAESPNRIGKDVFLFGLTDGGKLVPAGSREYNNNTFLKTEELDENGEPKLDESGNTIIKYVVDPLPIYNDAHGGDRCDSVVNTGRTCAARLVADGWEIKY